MVEGDRRGGQSDVIGERLKAPFLSLQMEKGPEIKACSETPEAGKGKQMDSPLETPEDNAVLLTPPF